MQISVVGFSAEDVVGPLKMGSCFENDTLARATLPVQELLQQFVTSLSLHGLSGYGNVLQNFENFAAGNKDKSHGTGIVIYHTCETLTTIACSTTCTGDLSTFVNIKLRLTTVERNCTRYRSGQLVESVSCGFILQSFKHILVSASHKSIDRSRINSFDDVNRGGRYLY